MAMQAETIDTGAPRVAHKLHQSHDARRVAGPTSQPNRHDRHYRRAAKHRARAQAAAIARLHRDAAAGRDVRGWLLVVALVLALPGYLVGCVVGGWPW
jgi:hypothetical protein